ncbi:glycosyl hydrolase family 16 [Colletotrichum plurivorum]|uniref:Glycosyl hydrolase family 16 n=1 Tax=Colletotrichum plurivorum TaxID=2175906 RepID=A0A8H6JUN6_9PEZI|nr:glycosyl hydrolase family 16 [Colletotrichum plurivorum]
MPPPRREGYGWTSLSPVSGLGVLLPFLLSVHAVAAQTFRTCNPIERSCDPVPALGSTVDVAFSRRGRVDPFVRDGTGADITFDPEKGAGFVVGTRTDAPSIALPGAIFFGRVDLLMQAAEGEGVVAFVALQSDSGDEIGLDFAGGDTIQVQTTYLSQGGASTRGRTKTHGVERPLGAFYNYSISWTGDRVLWIVGGVTVRELLAGEVGGEFPQTPMRLRIGSRALGAANFSTGPLRTYLKRITVVDEAAGAVNATAYTYGDKSGTRASINITTSREGNQNVIDVDDDDDDTASSPAPSSTTVPDPSSTTAPDSSSTTSARPSYEDGPLSQGPLGGIIVGSLGFVFGLGAVMVVRHMRNKSRLAEEKNRWCAANPETDGRGDSDDGSYGKPELEAAYIQRYELEARDVEKYELEARDVEKEARDLEKGCRERDDGSGSETSAAEISETLTPSRSFSRERAEHPSELDTCSTPPDNPKYLPEIKLLVRH